jgi:hypothetical protein
MKIGRTLAMTLLIAGLSLCVAVIVMATIHS